MRWHCMLVLCMHAVTHLRQLPTVEITGGDVKITGLSSSALSPIFLYINTRRCHPAISRVARFLSHVKFHPRTGYIPRANRVVRFKNFDVILFELVFGPINFGDQYTFIAESLDFFWILEHRDPWPAWPETTEKFSPRKISPRDHSSESTALIYAGIGRLITDEGLYAKAVAHYRGAWAKMKVYGAWHEPLKNYTCPSLSTSLLRANKINLCFVADGNALCSWFIYHALLICVLHTENATLFALKRGKIFAIILLLRKESRLFFFFKREEKLTRAA